MGRLKAVSSRILICTQWIQWACHGRLGDDDVCHRLCYCVRQRQKLKRAAKTWDASFYSIIMKERVGRLRKLPLSVLLESSDSFRAI